MTGKMKIIKQKSLSIGADKTHKLTAFRKKFKYDDKSGNIENWIKSVDVTIKENKIVPSVLVYYKTPNPEKPTELPLPPQLNQFVNFMLEDRRIPLDEVRGYMFSVIKPLEDYPEDAVKKNKEIVVEQCKAFVSDRFILFGNSNELLTYQLIDVSKMKVLNNLAPGQQVVENIEEQVKRNDVIHMELQGAIASKLMVDNKNFYRPPHRDGWRDENVKKNPHKRFLLVFDVIATTEKVKTVLREKLDMITQLMNDKPDSAQARAIKAIQPQLEVKKSSTCEDDDSDSDVEDVTPQLVKVPVKESKTNIDQEVLDNL